ncbi:MAG TPA: hypothetical protein VK191_09525 [Symbiobacteriaceae bacterium]|nr:hypothetical protein [Symbiobacteriaceae bacterium]
MSQWLIALASVLLKALLDSLFRFYERRKAPPAVDKPARRRRRRRIA